MLDEKTERGVKCPPQGQDIEDVLPAGKFPEHLECSTVGAQDPVPFRRSLTTNAKIEFEAIHHSMALCLPFSALRFAFRFPSPRLCSRSPIR